MKKILFPLLMLCSLAALAQEISADESLQRAVEQIRGKSHSRRVRGKADFALVHTEKSRPNGKALYYVFGSDRDDGFLIGGADLRTNAVLGYTESGTYEEALQIPAFRSWLSGCREAMQWVGTHTAVPPLRMNLPGRRYAQDATLPSRVEPLLGDISWAQDEPYNRLCPELTEDERCATGCVATATAQIMKYYEWPKQGTGSHSCTTEGDVVAHLEADFSQSVYDWDNMLSSYKGEYTDVQAAAVAKLMSDVGVAVDMMYGSTSLAYHSKTAYALATYFGYDKDIQILERTYFTYDQWNDLLKGELAEARPVSISGQNAYENAGHAFVIDGYDEEGLYHVNWGWGGMSDGYYDINFLNPDLQGTGGSRYGYPANQIVTVHCLPDKDGSSQAHSLMAVTVEPTLEGDSICCRIDNYGLAPYVGKAGYVAYMDGELVGSYFDVIDESHAIEFMEGGSLVARLSDLGITTEMLGDKDCYVFPAYLDGDDYDLPLSKVAFQNYVNVSVDENGEIVSLKGLSDNAEPVCERIEVTRDYVGFDVKAKAVISNKEDRQTFDRVITMIIYDEAGNEIAQGSNFAYLDAGQSRELEFLCELNDGMVMKEGQTYTAQLVYVARGWQKLIPGSKTSITLKDPGPAPEVSYADFALDKTVIAPNEELTVSFDATNAGGFAAVDFDIAVFKEGEDQSFLVFTLADVDVPNGTTRITATKRMDIEAGDYFICVFTGDDEVNPDALTFSVENSATAIRSVADNADAPCLYYDLQGRRVVSPSKGVYVKGGKKMVK